MRSVSILVTSQFLLRKNMHVCLSTRSTDGSTVSSGNVKKSVVLGLKPSRIVQVQWQVSEIRHILKCEGKAADSSQNLTT